MRRCLETHAWKYSAGLRSGDPMNGLSCLLVLVQMAEGDPGGLRVMALLTFRGGI